MGAPGCRQWPAVLGRRAVIFVTVGTQLGFDRLVQSVDKWAGQNPQVEVFGQVANGGYRCQHFKTEKFVKPARLVEVVQSSSLIVSHAGMGSILTALKFRKPIVIMPRISALGEHRNDHQIATAKWLSDRPGVFVASDEAALFEILDKRDELVVGGGIAEFAPAKFVDRIGSWIKA